MKLGPATLGILGILACLAAPASSFAQYRDRPWLSELSRSRNKAPWPLPVAASALPPEVREQISKAVLSPTMMARGPAEEFPANCYDWLLDHPDRVALAWRRLGVPCVGIVSRGEGVFGWNDGQGSDLAWQCVWRSTAGRIWYAEGRARPGPHLPAIPVRAVAVLRCSQRRESDGRTFVTHDIDVYMQTDSRAAALIMKLIGPAAPHLAEQGASQLLLFFSGIARHLEAHPEQTMDLLKS
jgi:hypothetical protein